MADEQQLRDYLRRVTIELAEERERLHAYRHAPIAIVGMACRYPGGIGSPQDMWDLVVEGRDGITEFPADRGWDLENLYHPDPAHRGTSYSNQGGFIDAAQFDPEFFGISPREALAMDPQQRFLMEGCWEALEEAGIDPATLHGGSTGVFAGVSGGFTGGSGEVAAELEGYRLTGTTTSVASGRISYTFGFEGPSFTVDTACSSSLVAMHLACQALRSDECSLAVVGGATVLDTTETFVEFSRMRVMAPDGRCKSFAEAADGTGWSEGAGVLLLERLSDAQRNGHPVQAVLRGTAINQDGASNGLTAPNGPSQERVIRQALANARLTPQEVDAVEAHGTGTTLGDPIEANALMATYGQDRDVPLKLGSIKSNLGHSVAAAGVAGVIKMVMAMREGMLPPTIHVDRPTTNVDWTKGKVELVTEPEPWEVDGRPRRAAVSSFGISGTNAHVILEEAPATGLAGDGDANTPVVVSAASSEDSQEAEPKSAPLPDLRPLVLSAKTEPALREAAERLSTHLKENPDLDLTDLAFSLATSRASLEQRAVITASDPKEVLSALSALAEGSPNEDLITATARTERGPAFLFAGQGAQHPQMALELLEASPAFATHIEACEKALSPHVDWSLTEILREEDGKWMDRLDIVQPALFAVMVSLAKLWMDLGVKPSVVAGHSQGEIAAAHISGALSLEDAAKVIALRAKAMTKLAGKGGMLSVSLPTEKIDSLIEPYGDRVSLAATNGPASQVLSGEPDALEEILKSCESDGIRAQKIAVDYAAHSAQIEDLEAELLEAFSEISPKPSQIPFHSTVTGEVIDTTELDASYWYRNLRQTVQMEPVLRSLLNQGQRCFIEIGPHPVLGFGLQETIDDVLADDDATVIATLRRGEGGPKRFAHSLAQAHAAGAELDWEAVFAGSDARRVGLPTYPFQRRRFWVESAGEVGDVSAAGLDNPDHPMLGATVTLVGDEGGSTVFTGRLSASTQTWLAEHVVLDSVIVPGTAYVEMALEAGRELGVETVDELTQEMPLVIAESGAAQIQLGVEEADADGRRAFAVYSRTEGAGEEWSRNASGVLAPTTAAAPSLELGEWPPPGAEPLDVEGVYDQIAATGIEFGPAFQSLKTAWRSGGELFAEIELPEERREGAARFGVHPALLDSALHVATIAQPGREADGPQLPFTWNRVSLHEPGEAAVRVRLQPGEETLSLTAFDRAGLPVFEIGALVTRAIPPEQLANAKRRRQPLYGVEWRETALDDGPESVATIGAAALPGAPRYESPAAMAAAISAGEGGPAAVLFAPGPEDGADGPARAARVATEAGLELLQGWLAEEALAGSRLIFLTEGAAAVDDGENADPVGAAIWGLVRSAQAEHPGRFSLVDTDGSAESTEALVAALGAVEEPQLALRNGIARAPRVAPLTASAAAAAGEGEAAPPFDPEKTVLITGATGTLGALVARHLVAEHGARHLLLISRSGPTAEGAAELEAELTELGAEVEIAACDAAERGALEALLAGIGDAHPLGAVVHAAGTLADATVESLTAEQVEAVFAPKADAAWNLHELTGDAELSAFIGFSSIVGTLGSPGQANYAAASGFLDGLARRRRSEGLPATSIAFGLWAQASGMTGHLEAADIERMARTGFEPLSDEKGLGLFDAALQADRAHALALGLNSGGLRAQAQAGTIAPILRGLVREQTRRGGSAALAARLQGLSEEERRRAVLEQVQAEVAAVLGEGSPASIDPENDFKSMGFDSLAAVELRNRLSAGTGLRLAATTVFDYPNPEKLAGYLLAQASAGGVAGKVAVQAQASDEPIAIVGMACRYPGGASSPDGLWQMVAEGRDGVRGFPDDRGWDLERLYSPDPEQSGTSYVREGGFLADAAEFDAEFFGISPREALAMDPQQRLLLEACWEALEDAGIDPASLRGEPAGVFAGVSAGGYTPVTRQEEEKLEGYHLTGTTTSVASGRVAYTLGLEGPAMSIDTACSSSLVAMHLACQSLRSGECSLALAGGATVLAIPGIFTEFSRQRGLAPDGRCKSFAEAADGTGWAEGAGALLLERLSDAKRNGHPILATMRGSAINQDGASNGLTAPNGPSQERVIRQALANARLAPGEVDAVEAHGTGTVLGDPIEAQAVIATYGQDRDEPLRLGSIKSNIGHAQAAAGVASVIKMVMAMREGVLPPTLHVDEPTSHVDWSAGKVELLTEAQPWEPNGRPRRAGVSSFGISGTNAHVILEEAPVSDRGAGAPTDSDSSSKDFEAAALAQLPLVLSAKSEAALAEAASRLAAHLKENPDVDLTDVAFSLATTRSALEQRGVVTATDRKEVLAALAALADGTSAPNLTTATAQTGRTAFLLTGQGAQRAGMGSELYESFPAYAEALDEVIAELDKRTDRPMKELIFSEPDSAEAKLLDHTTYAQPALFATEIAIYRLLESFGVTPDLLTGHSIGEIAAAHLSGVFSLEDAAKLVVARGALMGALPDGGAMLAIGASEADVAASLEGKEKHLSIATINGPTSIVISGTEKAIEAAQAEWDEKGAKTKRLTVSHAFHSPLMEPMLDDFAEVAESLTYSDPKIPIVSNRSGEILAAEDATDPAYWVSHVREPVRFADAVITLASQGSTRLIEVGPDAVLTAMARECLADSDQQPAFVATMRREHSEAETFTTALAGVHASGADLDWNAVFAGRDAKRVSLPTYPFQRKRYWVEASDGVGDVSAAGLVDPDHPLLGAAIESPHDGSLSFSGRLSLQTHPWLADHAVAGTVLLPGTAFVELALKAGERAGVAHLAELTLQAPLVIPEGGAVQLQLTLAAPGEDGQREIAIHSRPEGSDEDEIDAGEWTYHAEGLLSDAESPAPAPLAEWPPPDSTPIEVEFLYDTLGDIGLEYGPAFRGLTAAWQNGEAIYAEVTLGEEQRDSAARFGIHPALLDAALHGANLGQAEAGAPRLPFAWSGVSLHGTGAGSLRVRLETLADEAITLAVFDSEGAPLAEVASLVGRPISVEQLAGAKRRAQSLYGIEWEEASLEDGEPAGVAALGGVQLTGAEAYEGIAALTEAIADGGRVPEVVVAELEVPGGDLAGAALGTTVATLELLKAFLAEESLAASRLAIVSRGAIAAGADESPDPAAAAPWGLLRSAQIEHPERLLLIDTDGSDASAEVLTTALVAGNEAQLALREGRALAPRIGPARDRPDSLLPPAGPWQLGSTKTGTLEGLALISHPRAAEPLAPGEVRIAVEAAGVNFRDVLIALGQYPGAASIGSEGAGTVVEVGSEVTDLAPGDRVMGPVLETFAPFAIADRRLLAPIPDGWSAEQAASVPTVFMTAHYALIALASLQKGERILVHAGAGGVGMAAIQVAQHLGAEVFATASPAKWDALRELGLDEDHLSSSRDLDFKEKFAASAGEGGFDVVLNSLTGEFIDASIGLLGDGGRFVEMGKTDIRDPERVAEEHPGVSYLPFDLSEEDAGRTGEMLAETLELFERGALRHSPIAGWDIRQAPEAFRHLREGRNVGKVVLTLPEGIDPERTVLITGATGALGSLIARHLVAEHGARHLLLVSRSGAKAEGVGELKAELEELGAEVEVAACDASDRVALKKLLGGIPDEHPLGAVVHAAGVLADATVETLTEEQLEAAFAPKVGAAWNLHELTEGADLSAFVAFSSIVGTLGSPGQGSYAAASAFLDALAERRRREGLPAASIAWGVWGEALGMAGRVTDADLERMARGGFEALDNEQGLALLDAALAADRPLTLGVRLDSAGLRAQAQAGALPPMLSGLVRTPTRRAGGAALTAKLAGLSEDEQQRVALEMVRGEIAAVLGHSSAESIAPQAAFKDLGFDSLAAVELRNRLNAATGLRLSATSVFDYPSPERLAAYLLAEVSASGAGRQVAVRAQSNDEPIAIVGMACRYPGDVGSPQDLWRLVAEGRDGITEFPEDRGWDLERIFNPDPENVGTSYVREGGFVTDVANFDAEFFGISPREALAMDPQQRLLLEACWEALEDAGIEPASLRGDRVGVFAGVTAANYTPAGSAISAPELEGYHLTGTTTSVASGRVAYTLGLEGPAMSIDTACSSSLVAMHLASQALRGGECSLALTGGTTVHSTPGLFTEFSRQRGLAPDGRCKSFAEGADGTGWSEGTGVVLLERLSDAQRNGHAILAVMRGSATNQDGASNGLTAPNGPSQERVIRQALANSGLTPQEVDAVEAHGTGTTLGDPIEAQAVLATYGQEREEPLRLGSIKSNIGHSAGSAGVAGVIKMVMAMREGVLPPTLHVDEPTTNVDWTRGNVELLTEAQPWEPNGRPRRAGVSSFGISGTNAHVILEEAPESDLAGNGGAGAPTDSGASSKDFEAATLRSLPLVLSAKSEAALAEAASRLAAHLKENTDFDLADVAYSLATSRSALEQRAVVTASDRAEALAALAALADGTSAPNLTTATAQQGRTAFLLTGQGAQRAGMGSELYESFPAYAEALDEVIAELDRHTDRPMKELIFSEPDSDEATLLDHTTYAQPALFATEIAIYRLLESFGVTPDLLTGHSIGEIAAAHLSGVFSLEDASKLVAARGALMGALPDGGAMLAIGAPEDEVAKSLEGKEADLSIATINGPTSIVISGTEKAIEEAQKLWDEKGAKTKRLTVSHAFHSPLMEPMLEEFAEVAKSLTYSDPKIPIVSNCSGEILAAEDATDSAYWVAHVREPVRFADAVSTLSAQGATRLIEVGPDAVLTAMARECLADSDQQPAFVATMRRDHAEAETFSGALAGAHASGADLDWKAIFAGRDAKRVSLPTYPFQRKRFWLEAGGGDGDLIAAGQSSADHPLLGASVELAEGQGTLFTARLSLRTQPWLADHAVAGIPILPGTAFVELALHAGERVGTPHLRELTLQAPLVLPEEGALQLQLTLAEAGEDGMRQLSIHSRPEASGGELGGAVEWTSHADGLLGAAGASTPEPLTEWPPIDAAPIDVEFLYDQLAEIGLEYGPAFQGLTAAWRDGEAIYAEVSLAEEQRDSATRFGLHPALLDAALHGATLGSAEMDGPRLPFSWNDVSLFGSGADSLRVRLESGEDSVSLTVFDRDGAALAEVGSLAVRAISADQLAGAKRRSESLYEVEWNEIALEEASEAGSENGEVPAAVVREAEIPEAANSAAAALAATQGTLATVQEWLAEEANADSRLALITRGAVAIGPGESPDPAAGALWGLLRSAQSEHPDRFALIDTDGTEASAEALGAALAITDDEPQLALRDGKASAPRVAPAADRPDSLLPPAGPWRLASTKRGTLEGLALVPNPPATEPLGPTEVRISMRAAGLNFRDVLIALGHYPGEATIGSEGAGVVVEVGSEVDDLAPGDRVMGTISDAFGPLAGTERALVVPVPKDWSFEQGAAIPTVFMTAYYALTDLADLKKGEKVLIHAGAGGVGMAAVQIANHLGAEVFATASSAKWDALRELGLDEDHLASSRDLDFKEKFAASAGEGGLDVVLNALAGEFIDASLDLLGEGGRFLEMGKTDVRDSERLSDERPGISYEPFDLIETGPEWTTATLTELLGLFERGALRHSPISTWDMRRAPEAFRHLREGQNVGKVVLTLPSGIDAEKTTLITGGTGALGSLVARHMVTEHGARNLLLISRSGSKAEGAVELKAELEELGAKVKIAACDAADPEALKALLAKLPKSHPLGAVVHAAGTLEDATLEAMESDQVATVFAPKVDVAWNLHELTKGLDLSAFVTFSSFAGTLGTPAQANYAAANVFLDSLAQRRRAEGLPATSVAWGLWAGAGMTGDLSEAELARVARGGIETISVEQGLALLDAALGSDRALTLGVRLNSAGLKAQAQAGTLPPILSGLVRASTRRQGGAVLAAKLAGLSTEDQERLVLDLVRGEVAAVLGHSSAEAIPAAGAFKDLGFDSLAAVELRNRLNAASGQRLAATTVFDYPNPEKLAEHLLEKLAPGGGRAAELDPREREVRDALASIPLARLRSAGLIDSLMHLANGGDGDEPEAADDGDLIDTMDVDELIRMSAVGGDEPVEDSDE